MIFGRTAQNAARDPNVNAMGLKESGSPLFEVPTLGKAEGRTRSRKETVANCVIENLDLDDRIRGELP